MPTKVFGPTNEEIRAQIRRSSVRHQLNRGYDPMNVVEATEWAQHVKREADRLYDEAEAPKRLKAARERFVGILAERASPEPPPPPPQIRTQLRAGMVFDAWGNTCCIDEVDGDVAKCRILWLNDPHAQGKARPQGWPSSYWEEGQTYTLHRHPNFPDLDEWYFAEGEMKRDDSMLLLLVENGDITFDMDS